MTTYVQSAFNKFETPSGAIGEAPDPAGDLLHLRDQIDQRLGAGGAELTTTADMPNIPTSRCFIGKLAYCADTVITYRWNGTAWKLWHAPSRTYTPTPAGWSQGSAGGLGATWQAAAGKCFVDFDLVCGTGGGVTSGGPQIALPFKAYEANGRPLLGTVNLVAADGTIYPGTLTPTPDQFYAYPLAQDASGAYAKAAVLNPGLPFTWGAGCRLSAAFVFTPQA